MRAHYYPSSDGPGSLPDSDEHSAYREALAALALALDVPGGESVASEDFAGLAPGTVESYLTGKNDDPATGKSRIMKALVDGIERLSVEAGEERDGPDWDRPLIRAVREEIAMLDAPEIVIPPESYRGGGDSPPAKEDGDDSTASEDGGDSTASEDGEDSTLSMCWEDIRESLVSEREKDTSLEFPTDVLIILEKHAEDAAAAAMQIYFELGGDRDIVPELHKIEAYLLDCSLDTLIPAVESLRDKALNAPGGEDSTASEDGGDSTASEDGEDGEDIRYCADCDDEIVLDPDSDICSGCIHADDQMQVCCDRCYGRGDGTLYAPVLRNLGTKEIHLCAECAKDYPHYPDCEVCLTADDAPDSHSWGEPVSDYPSGISEELFLDV